MAGSYKHIIDENGYLIPNEEFPNYIENLGDAYEMAEECWYLIQILSDGDDEKIEKALQTMYQMLNRKVCDHFWTWESFKKRYSCDKCGEIHPDYKLKTK